MPKVSIVIPTRNRAHLLRSALSSALGQTYRDLEILVSDNFSQDDTRSIFDSFVDSRLRYVRTPSAVTMPESWEFALEHARGEYVTFLPDDDCLFSDAIETAVSQLENSDFEVAVWTMCSYFAPEWFEPRRRNLLYVPRTTFQSRAIASHEALRSLFEQLSNPHVPVPRFLNSLCHRKVIDRVRQVQGKMFWPPAPDFSSAVGILQNIRQYLYLDRPMFVDAMTPVSIGAAGRFNWGAAAEEFMREFGDKLNFIDKFGLDVPTIALNIALSIETVKEFYPNASALKVDRQKLVRRIVDDLTVNEDNGADMSEAWRRLNEFLARQPAGVRRAAAAEKRRSRMAMALKKVRNLPFWEYFERIRGIHVFRGSEWGFRNLDECSHVAERLVKSLEAKAVKKPRPDEALETA